jgi:radical SAM protein with 4Fe4S-binding SPASM domain
MVIYLQQIRIADGLRMDRKINSGLHILEIELTNRCNLNCKHCYLGDKSIKHELDKKTLLKLIRDAHLLGVHDLVFTGGEPLLVNELPDLVAYAKKFKFPRIGLQTNGLLINNKNINIIKQFTFVQLSFDSFSKNSLRFGLEDKVIEIAKKLKRNKIDVIIQCTLRKSNIRHIPAIVELSKKINIPVGFNRLCLIGNAQKFLKNEVLSKKLLKKALFKIYKLKLSPKYNGLVRCSDPLLVLFDEKKKEYSQKHKNLICGGCIAGIASCYVASNGDVYPCPFIRKSAGNIYKDSLIKIWFQSKLFRKLRRRSNIKGKCSLCEYLNICGGCRGSALALKNDIFAEDSFCWR